MPAACSPICIDSDDEAAGIFDQASELAVLRLDGIELKERDLELLDSKKFLNDSLIDFFLRLIVDIVAPTHLRGEIYVASTFFYQKLTSGGVQNGQEGWENVQRWTRSLPGGLLAQRYFIVPINEQNLHWWLAVVCYPGSIIGETVTTKGETPRIVCLDSADDDGGDEGPSPQEYHRRAASFLRGYVMRECRERRSPGAGQSKQQALKAAVADVPKQGNGYDCGIFILEFVLHLLQSRSALYGLGLTVHKHWFSQYVVSHRRRRLKALVLDLAEQARLRCEPDVQQLLQDTELRDEVIAAFTDKPSGSRELEEQEREAAGGNPDPLPKKRPRPPQAPPPAHLTAKAPSAVNATPEAPETPSMNWAAVSAAAAAAAAAAEEEEEALRAEREQMSRQRVWGLLCSKASAAESDQKRQRGG